MPLIAFWKMLWSSSLYAFGASNEIPPITVTTAAASSLVIVLAWQADEVSVQLFNNPALDR